ncbi:MAG TPA: glycosyltransferase family 2 protein, partial [Leptospiraceae bacterium]|nr:glycosyltransferase family 2 protein [Leptospiraceae bacterium]
MDNIKKIWILLPAFNEEESLPRLLPKLAEFCANEAQEYTIVVVNDGSLDSTLDYLQKNKSQFKIEILNHVINRGLGETERDGFEYISSVCDDNDVIIRMDCDDTHEPMYIPLHCQKMKDGFDVVISSRFQKGGGQKGVNAYRSFISYCANLFMKLLFPISGVWDYSCGYRSYKGRIIKDAVRTYGNGFVQLKGLGFTSTLETIVKLRLLGARFSEIPFVLRYDQKASPSKMISSITTLGYLTMAVLYHWPFSGWRRSYKGLKELYRSNPEEAVKAYNRFTIKRGLTT